MTWPYIENIENKHVLLLLLVCLTLWTTCIFYLPKDNLLAHRIFGNIFSLATLYICMILACNFDRLKTNYQFVTHVKLLPEYGINLSLGVDGISLALLLLTAFISSCCVFICSYTMDITRCRPLLIQIFLIEICVLGAFCVTNLFFSSFFLKASWFPCFLWLEILVHVVEKLMPRIIFFFIP